MFIDYKGTRIHYKVSGKGPSLVLLHGFLESSTMWATVSPMLSQKNTVINIDLPGHGKSEVASKIHSMELMAEIVHHVLENTETKTATFIGHSMGGYVSLAFAELYPESVEKLILVNSTPEADSEERKKNRDRAVNLLTSHSKAYINMAIGNLIAIDSRDKYAKELDVLKSEALSFPVEGLKSAVRGMRDRKDRTEVLKNFRNEKYMILSSEDPILPLEETKLAAKNAQTPIKIIDGGHLSLIENIKDIGPLLETLT